MDLEYSEDQENLRASVRDFLAKECPVSLARQVVEGSGSGESLWKSMTDLDWPALGFPERWGGVGLGYPEIAIVAEEQGAALAPVPWLATATQFVPALVRVGSPEQCERFLAPVTRGSTGALALADDPARWGAEDVLATARETRDGWELSGTKTMVGADASTQEVVVVARVSGHESSGSPPLGLFVVAGSQLAFEPLHGLDPTRPLSKIRLDGVTVPADRVLGQPGDPDLVNALARVIDEATVAMALDALGASRALFDLVLAYTKDRIQFGVPIGSFQAVKHKMADLFVELQRAQVLCRYAVAAIAEDDRSRRQAVSMAKAASDDCERAVCKDSIQTFGGIAFTWEHDAHLYVKRATASGALFGNALFHRPRVAMGFGL